MIPSPNLDDRTYTDIVNEARRLIPRYCPEWTNHNPTDPGMTLVELFAWMTETTIYRLNKVPDKTYLTLLDLLGLSLVPPQPAKTVLTFKVVEGYKSEVNIKKGSLVSSNRGNGEENVVFETENDIIATSARIIGVHNRVGDVITDITKEVVTGQGAKLFSGTDSVERFIYFQSNELKFLEDNNALAVHFVVNHEISSVQEEIVNFLDWEYWDGAKWVFFDTQRGLDGELRSDNKIFLCGPIAIEETEVNGVTGFFIRGSLRALPSSRRAFDIVNANLQIIFRGEGLAPDKLLSNTSNMVFQELDQGKDYCPFPGIPKYNDTFYLSCEEVLAKKGAEASLLFNLSEAAQPPVANDSLLLKWEYWNGKSWKTLGDTTLKGSTDPSGLDFVDNTNAFNKSGKVSFLIPNDIAATDIGGDNLHWIRIRISSGDFGTGGQHIQKEDNTWEWVFSSPVTPPYFDRIRLHFKLKPDIPEECFVYENFEFDSHHDLWKDNQQLLNNEKTPNTNRVFKISEDRTPYVYLGYDRLPSKSRTQVYFRMDDGEKIKPSLDNKFTGDVVNLERSSGLVWEYFDGKDWNTLMVDDRTDSFHSSGFCSFSVPQSWPLTSEFNKEGYWLRVGFNSGSFESCPELLGIHLNTVYASNQRTYTGELLGSSSGSPNQSFTLLRTPVLPGIKLMVKEKSIPPESERILIEREEGSDCITEHNQEIWIRYHQVDNFHNSTPQDRHYMLDYQTGQIFFGDGVKGIIPPRDKNNIMVDSYQVGGGEKGNVAPHVLTVLRESIPFISGVSNHYKAEAGSDLESLHSLKHRASGVLKSLNRAVTSEDYEWLARESSASVGRAKCLEKLGAAGEVVVIILPQVRMATLDLSKRLYPTPELLKRVNAYLEPRKLIGTKLRVDRPAYRNVNISLNLILKRTVGDVDLVQKRVMDIIRRSYHPLVGGDGEGWPFGQDLSPADVTNRIEQIDAIQHVENVELNDINLGSVVEKVICRQDELIFIEDITISYRKYNG